MAITVKFRRGSTIQSNSFLGEEGELYIDKDKDTIVVHDGVTVGGKPLATESFVIDGLNTKQKTLASGVDIKTINGLSLLGSDDFSLVEKINITAGTVGSATEIPVIAYNEQGQITSVTTSALDLSTKVDKINIASGSVGSGTKIPVITYNEQGQITSVTDSLIDIQDIETRIGGTIATQGYVNTQVSNLVDSSPETLNTLNELAAALGDDPNFATTIANQIGLKANTSSLSTVATSGSYNDLTNKPDLSIYATSNLPAPFAGRIDFNAGTGPGGAPSSGVFINYGGGGFSGSALTVEGGSQTNIRVVGMDLRSSGQKINSLFGMGIDTSQPYPWEPFAIAGTEGNYNFNLQTNSVNRVIIAKGSGDVTINSTTSSNSVITGALVVKGGIGVSGNINTNASVSASSFIGSGSQLSDVNYTNLINKPSFPTSFADANGWISLGGFWKTKVDPTTQVLYFAYDNVNMMKLDSSGNLTVTGDITAFGTV